MGTSYFASKIIEDSIKKEIPIALVVTQPDRPVGRKKEITLPEAKKTAEKNNLSVKQFAKIDTLAINFFQAENPDLIIVASYGLILPQELIDLPRFGCVNVHTSMLPALRGPSPIQAALLDGLEKTGVSIMKMDSKIDHGPILKQEEVKIYKKYDYKMLEEKLAEVSNKILLPTIQDMLDKKIKPKEQNHHKATFTKIINKKDGRIIWSRSANQIEGLHKAFCVWPKIFCYWEKENQLGNHQKIIFWEIKSVKETSKSINKRYGEVFNNEKGKTLIKTGDGLIEIKKIQLPGKKAMDIDEFCNGQHQFIGAILN